VVPLSCRSPSASSADGEHYRYVKKGRNHFSLAFTYDVITWERDASARMPLFVLPEREDGHWIPLGEFMDGWGGL
jgi:hypothetical protein